MAYATVAQIRVLSSLTTADISDSDLTALIVESDKWVREQISTEVVLERVVGSVDGTNVYFTIQNLPGADNNASGTVDKDDITVYTRDWSTTKDAYEYSSVAITTFTAIDGLITLTAAPTVAGAGEGVFCNYRYYKSGRAPDFARINMASSYYACFLAVQKIYAHVPLSFASGTMKVFKGTPGQNFLDMAWQIIRSLNGGTTTFRRVEGARRNP